MYLRLKNHHTPHTLNSNYCLNYEPNLSLKYTLLKNIFYTRETIRGIRISPLAETHPLFHNWLRML